MNNAHQTTRGLERALTYRGGNVARTAEDIGVSRRTLDRYIVALDLRAWLTKTYPPAQGMRTRRPAEQTS